MKTLLIIVFITATIGGIYYLNHAEGKFCGGIAANLTQNQCPIGYICQPEGSYPDAGGKCVNILKSLLKSTPPRQPTPSQQSIPQASSSASASPAPTGAGETTNWKTYTCPNDEWVNCMPMVGPGGKLPQNPQCTTEYLKWAKDNCPNFKGATY